MTDNSLMFTDLRLEADAHDDPNRVIGRRTTYTGAAHPFLRDHLVVIVAVIGDEVLLRTEQAVRAAGGVGPSALLEIAPVLPDGKLSFWTSDARPDELACFGRRD